MNPLDAHYAALGLSPEASAEEVRSAYRRLTKLYHPDQDASLDAQVRYREIRGAYEALRGRVTPPPQQSSGAPGPPPPPSGNAGFRRYSSYHAYSSSQDDDQDYDFENSYREYVNSAFKDAVQNDAAWRTPETLYFLGWEWKIPRRPPPRRRPFSLWALPGIIWESVDEIAGVEALARFLLSCWMLWRLGAPVSGTLTAGAIFALLCASAVFRYYHTRHPLDKGIYFLGSLCCGAAMSSFFIAWDIFLNERVNHIFIKFFYYTASFYAAILPLWVHPILWAASGKKKGR